jgi:phosphate uptake regulator
MLKFKELYELWRSDNSLTQAIHDSHKMLEETFEMFRESVASLRQSDTGDLKINVYQKDQVVNTYIREVRRKVLKHLAITGGMNIIPGLILTSIVVDIERIGDYTKNIMDLAVAHPRRLKGREYEESFQEIEQTVLETFQKLIPILRESDKAAATELHKKNYWVLKKCDEIVTGLIKEENKKNTQKDAATRALYARHLKRISAHLFNIASSVVNPFEHIGFKPEEAGA